MELKFQVQTKIQKSVSEVFDAVYNPKKLSGYFTTAGASGPLDEGKEVLWKFSDFDGEPIVVQVHKMIKDKALILAWNAHESDDCKDHGAGNNYKTKIEMHFESLGANETLVKISESGWKETQAALNGSYMNCQGWMNMSCCLKAYLEYGINLRKGFF